MDESDLSDNDIDNKDYCDTPINRHRNNKRIKIQTIPPMEGTSNDRDNQEPPGLPSTSNSDSSPGTTIQTTRNYSSGNRNNSLREDSSANESGDEAAVEDTNTESIVSFDEYSTTTPETPSSLLRETDTESEADETFPVLKKQKPKHTWYVVPEVIKRQFGYSSKLHSAELFRNQCYGSLHCVQRLELMYKLEKHFGCVNSLNFHPDGTLLASGSDDLHITIWDWKIGKCLVKYHSKHRSNVFQSKFLHLAGNLHIASCSRDGQVRIGQLSRDGSFRGSRKLGTHKLPCHKLAVLPDQPHIILSAGEDSAVFSHDIRKTKSDTIVNVKKDGRQVPLYSIHGHPLRTHEFCVGGKDDAVRVYDQRKSSSPISSYHPFKKNEVNHYRGLHVTSAMYNYNGREILASYNDADIFLFDSNSTNPGEYIHKYEGHRNGATIKGVSFFGPRSEFIVSGSDCGNIFFWEKHTEAIVQCMLGDDSGVVNCLEPHPTMPYICTSGLDWDVKVWVPSCETEPTLEYLPQIVKKNKKPISPIGLAAADAPILWMLWQHLRRGTSSRRRILRDINYGTATILTSSDEDEDMAETLGDEDDDDDDEDDDDDSASIDFSSECTTS